MIRIDFHGKKYKLWFRHVRRSASDLRTDFAEQPPNYKVGSFMCTDALLSCDERFVSSGMSICSPQDNWCKAVGRRIAMARALEPSSVPDKALRRELWQEYWRTHKKTGCAPPKKANKLSIER